MDLNIVPKTILIAPLNWGLGHATRCIPIIKALQDHNYTPIIASDGLALEILKKEFPQLKFLELPSYHIEYPRKGANFKFKILSNLPKILTAIRREKKLVNEWINTYKIDGIISDNRFGVISKKIPSVFITHQLNVLTGTTSWISSKLHQRIVKRFKECWVPDNELTPNLSGKLGHLQQSKLNLKYIGPLSRFQKRTYELKYDLLIILSGPEPQRGLLEEKLKGQLKEYNGTVLFIKGVVEQQQKIESSQNVTFYNYITSPQLEQVLNQSKIVLCRSGYTSIMDLSILRKKAFFIPTPGQFEQEYLAKKFKSDGEVPYATQEDFTIQQLEEVKHYSGLPLLKTELNWKLLFTVFESSKL